MKNFSGIFIFCSAAFLMQVKVNVARPKNDGGGGGRGGYGGGGWYLINF